MAAQIRPSNSGVRNLAAMFENKDENATSPPNRGRSPAGSLGARSNAPSPRPLSKVRTSFVAVERSGQLGGQLGLVKTVSNSNSAGTEDEMKDRREAFSIDEQSHPLETAVRKMSLADEITARRQSTVVTETIPENAISTPMESARPVLAESTSYMNEKRVAQKPKLIYSTQIGNPDKFTDIEDTEAELLPAVTTDEATVSGGKALQHNNGATLTSIKSNDKAAKSPSPLKSSTTVSNASSRPSPIATQPSPTDAKEKNQVSDSPRAAGTPKTPKTPKTPNTTSTTPSTTAKSGEPKDKAPPKSLRKTDEAVGDNPTHSIGSGSAKASKTTTNGVATEASPRELATVPSQNDAPKPKIKTKSATRTGHASSTIMAPTTSSLSKASSTVTSLPRKQPHHDASQRQTAKRSPSSATLAQSTSSSGQRIGSGIGKAEPGGRTRPSLGPSPADALRKQPSRQSLPKHTDESFLARMMRPTAASASKAHEKVVTPPRTKTATHPHAKGDHSTHAAVKTTTGSPSSKKVTSAHNSSKLPAEVQDPALNANGAKKIDESKMHEKKEAQESIHGPKVDSADPTLPMSKAAATEVENANPLISEPPSHVKHEGNAIAGSTAAIPDHATSDIKKESQHASAGPIDAVKISDDENKDQVVSPAIKQEPGEEHSQSASAESQKDLVTPLKTENSDAMTLEKLW